MTWLMHVAEAVGVLALIFLGVVISLWWLIRVVARWVAVGDQ